MHYITGSDTTSYLYGKGKVSALKTLRAGDFPGLYSALGEFDATHAQLIEEDRRSSVLYMASNRGPR